MTKLLNAKDGAATARLLCVPELASGFFVNGDGEIHPLELKAKTLREVGRDFPTLPWNGHYLVCSQRLYRIYE